MNKTIIHKPMVFFHSEKNQDHPPSVIIYDLKGDNIHERITQVINNHPHILVQYTTLARLIIDGHEPMLFMLSDRINQVAILVEGFSSKDDAINVLHVLLDLPYDDIKQHIS